MNIVLLFFCVILGIIFLAVILFVFSSIKLDIKKLNISNVENGTKKEKLEKEILIYLEIFLFKKIRIAKINLSNKRLLDKIQKKSNLKNIDKDIKIIKRTNIFKIIKKLKIRFEKVNFEAQIGTEEIMITVFLVTFFSTLSSILFRNTDKQNVEFSILPLYQYGNAINLRLNCIIYVKMVHIIYVIYFFTRKGMIKNERTSNRRSYDYSYE